MSAPTTRSGMTRLPGVPDSGDVEPGMAYFPDTGPFGRTCGDCHSRGYVRRSQHPTWNEEKQEDEYRLYHHYGCAMFKALTGHHGPVIGAELHACKYFEVKRGDENI